MSMKDDLKDKKVHIHKILSTITEILRTTKAPPWIWSKVYLYFGITEKHLLEYIQSTYRTESMSSFFFLNFKGT